MRAFFRKTALWLLLLPWVIGTLGAASNQLVLIANHDRFPVSINLVKAVKFATDDATILPDGTVMMDDTHCLMTSKTHLNLLADVFDFHQSIESIGDILLDFSDRIADFCYIAWFTFVILKLCSRTSKKPDGSAPSSSGPSDIPDLVTERITQNWNPYPVSDPYLADDTVSDL